MTSLQHFDVIIIGGSYSGLSAAMALGRALKKVLVIDSGKPCNRQTPHSHNFITHDGETPASIAALAKQQVQQYPTIEFHDDIATDGKRSGNLFEITTASGNVFHAKKLIFATGIRDIMPNIKGFSECWGISVIHCPYCHGYEVRGKKTGVIGTGDAGLEYFRLVSNWTNDITLIEKEISRIEHDNGHIRRVIFKDNTTLDLEVLYNRLPFEQHCSIPKQLGCEITEQGFLKTDIGQKTSIPGVYACGDNSSGLRTVSNAVAMGTTAGMMLNKEMVLENYSLVNS